jgi:hypothetical protein
MYCNTEINKRNNYFVTPKTKDRYVRRARLEPLAVVAPGRTQMSDITGIGSIFDFGSKIIDKIFPDKTQADQAKQALAMAQVQGQLADEAAQWDNLKAQIGVNAVEAGSSSLFVSGARPFIMWICGIGLAMQFLVAPIIQWGGACFGKVIVLPPLDMGTLMTLLGGLLGLGTMRTFEKIRGVAK